jgi:FKBP-type peptidyl-prolyl cis-trans isomerase
MKKEESEQKRTRSITKPRTIQGGIRIQDIVHGSGSAVRNGRRVSINYVGTFPNDGNKIFDKNQSKGKPLTFRLGTGEVIKGLDRGMIGMKVGGEREITIPPKLGYGEKGTSGIPGNSTLCFTVQLKSMGGK